MAGTTEDLQEGTQSQDQGGDNRIEQMVEQAKRTIPDHSPSNGSEGLTAQPQPSGDGEGTETAEGEGRSQPQGEGDGAREGSVSGSEQTAEGGQEAQAESGTQGETETQDRSEGEGGQQGQQESQQYDEKRINKATHALRRWQIPDELIQTLSTDELVRRGEKAAKTQAEQDRLANENRQLRSQVEQILAERQQQGTAGAERSSTQQAPQGQEGVEQQEDGQATSDTAETLLGDLDNDEILGEHAPKLRSAIQTIEQKANEKVESLKAQLQREREEKEQELNHLYAQLDEREFRDARRDLSEQLPDLKDTESFKRAKRRAQQLADAEIPDYVDEDGNHDFERLLRDAALIEGLGGQQANNGNRTQQQRKQGSSQDQAEAAQERSRRAQLQTQGQVTEDSPEENTPPIATKDPKEQRVWAAKAILNGQDRDAVRKSMERASSGRG